MSRLLCYFRFFFVIVGQKTVRVPVIQENEGDAVADVQIEQGGVSVATQGQVQGIFIIQ